MTEYDKRVLCTKQTKENFDSFLIKLQGFLIKKQNQDDGLAWLLDLGTKFIEEFETPPKFKEPQELNDSICDIHDDRLGVQSSSEIATVRVLIALNGDLRWNAYFHGGLFRLYDKIIDDLTREA